MNRQLTQHQSRYIQRAVRLRRKLTDKALAARFQVSENTVYYHSKKGRAQP